MKADLHAHTHFSRDAVTSIETFAKRYEAAGIDCVAVSDHNNVDGALAVNGIASFRVIIAEEIKSTEGEIIGLFLKETIRKGLTPEDTVKAIREQRGLVLIPHPFDRLRGSPLREEAILRIMPEIDVIEVFNARTTFQADDDKGRRLAEEHNKPMSAASDAHTPGEIGLAYTELPDFDGPEGFLISIGKSKLVGKRAFFGVHFISTWAKIKWRLRLGRRIAR